jgi:putative spermidine/putrescine transport system permease protein
MTRVIGPAGRLMLLVWFLVPLVPLLLWAVADRWPYPQPLPTEIGADGVEAAFGQGAGPALLRSLVLAAAVAAIATPLGAAAARALTFARVPGRRFVEIVLLAPVAIPPFAVVMGLNVLLLRWRVPGLLGVLLVLVVAAVPYTTYVMRVAYLGHDIGYEEEARTLGASPRAVRWRVHLPLLLPALTVSAFLAFLDGWSDYVVTLLVGGGQIVTLPMLLGATAAGTGNEATVAVLATLAVLCPLALFTVAAAVRRGRPPGTAPVGAADDRRPELVGAR